MYGIGLGAIGCAASTLTWQFTGFTPVQNSWFNDNVIVSPIGAAPPSIHDPYARVAIITSDTTITIEANPRNPSGTGIGDNDLADIGVWVNGIFNQSVLFNTPSFSKAQITISLPAGSNKLVEFEERASLTGINANFNLVPVNSPKNGRRIVIYGDSISAGFRANPFYAGWPILLRHKSGYGVNDYSISGDQLYAGLVNLGGNLANGIAIQAPRLVARCADGGTRKILWIQLGTNDYGLANGTPTQYESAYAGLVDAVHALDPSILIYCQTPVTRNNETGNNVLGFNLPNYRSQVVTVVSTRTSFCVLVDGTSFLVVGDLTDGVHPGTTGHAKYATSVGLTLGQLTIIVVPTTSVSALVVSQSTVAQQSRIRADTGLSSAGGGPPDLVNTWKDLGLLATRNNLWQGTGLNRTERSSFNGHPAVKFNPTTNIEFMLPTLNTAPDFKFLHGDGFTGIWVIQRIAAAVNGRIIDNIDSLSTTNCIGLAVAPIDSSRSMFIRVGNGVGTGFAWSLTSASNVLPVLGTTFVLDLRFSNANGLTARVNKTAFFTAVAVTGSLSSANPLHTTPTLGGI